MWMNELSVNYQRITSEWIVGLPSEAGTVFKQSFSQNKKEDSGWKGWIWEKKKKKLRQTEELF